MTTATGLGPLPELLVERESRKALRKVFAAESVPLAVIEHRQHKIPFATLAGLFTLAAKEAGDWRFGLDVGEAMPPGDYGLWARYAAQAPTLGDGLARIVRTLHLHQDFADMRLVPRPNGQVAWEYDHPGVSPAAFREHTDHIIPVMISFARGYLGPDWRPSGIEVGYAKPQQASKLEYTTETPWQFDASSLAILVPADALLTEKAQTAEQPGRGPFLSYSDVAAQSGLEKTYGPIDDIASVVALRLLDGEADIEGAACLLGWGRRKLQRRLEEQGLTYRSLVTELRMRRARSLIEGTEASLKRIGLELGYTDPAHFTRAFGRYYGFAPSHLRTR